jgi:protein transport protein SEC61 subunit gamma and related proteins
MKINLNPIPRLKNFSTQCKRVLMVSSKPDPQDLKLSAKITSVGMVIIGMIGFIIYMAVMLIGGL